MRGAGFVKLEAEEDDDMYHLFNLIAKGDTIEGVTVRNVRNDFYSVSFCNHALIRS